MAALTTELNEQMEVLGLYVVTLKGPALFGKDWLKFIKHKWNKVKTIYTNVVNSGSNLTLDSRLLKHKTIFETGI